MCLSRVRQTLDPAQGGSVRRRVLASQGFLTHLFVGLEAEVFETLLGKKLVALGLTSLLSLPTASLPPSVMQVLPHAFSAVVNVSVKGEGDWWSVRL